MNDTTMLIGITIAVAIALWIAFGRNRDERSSGFTGNVEHAERQFDAAPSPANASVDSAAFAAELERLLAAGNKIEAIKLVRERAGLGLKEAKDYVESGARGIEALNSTRTQPSLLSKPADDEMRRLIAAGHKIEAIKLLREHTGLGLKEAKDYVDQL